MLAYSKYNFFFWLIFYTTNCHMLTRMERWAGVRFILRPRMRSQFFLCEGGGRRRSCFSSSSHFCGRIINLPCFFLITEGEQTFSQFIRCLAWVKGNCFSGHFSFPELFLPPFCILSKEGEKWVKGGFFWWGGLWGRERMNNIGWAGIRREGWI